MKTDISNIRKIAKAFLNIDIAETEFDLLAQHPFTNSWFAYSDDYSLLDLHEERNRAIWKNKIEKVIDSSDLRKIMLLIQKTYRLQFIKYTRQYIDNHDLGIILHDYWQTIELISLDKSVHGKSILSWFKKADKNMLMNEKDLLFFENMPDEVTIYRGVTNYNCSKKKALSWSIDRNVAEWFAKRFSNYGVSSGEIWSLTIPKERIVCYFNAENEVIVDLYGFEAEMKIEKIN